MQETSKRKQKRIKSDRAVWILAKDSLHSIGKKGNRRLGLQRRRLRFQESLSKESRQSRVPGLSLPGLPSNFFFQPLELILRNLIHVVVQGRDYARSESREQPIDKPLDDPTLHLVLRIKPVRISGPSSSNGLIAGQNTLLEQPIESSTDSSVCKPATRMKVLSNLPSRGSAQPNNASQNCRF